MNCLFTEKCRKELVDNYLKSTIFILGCYKNIAISFVLDNSASAGAEGFEKSKEHIMVAMDYFNVGAAQFSVIDFNDVATTRIAFGEAKDLNDARQKVNSLTYQGKNGHNIGKALEKALNNLSIQRGRSRFIVMITVDDLVDENIRRVKRRMEQEGVTLVVLVIRNQRVFSNFSMLAKEENFFMVDSFDHLIESVIKVRENICRNSSN